MNSMTDRVFLDTNILVYAFDRGEPDKRAKALSILEDLAHKGVAVISTQVLQEFYVTVTRKLSPPLPETEAEAALHHLSRLPCVLIDQALIHSAIRLTRKHNFSLWDALILQSAIKGGCKTLLTEDLQHSFRLDDLQITNPFV
jgi:predicted nucleic acid-binding protein